MSGRDVRARLLAGVGIITIAAATALPAAAQVEDPKAEPPTTTTTTTTLEPPAPPAPSGKPDAKDPVPSPGAGALSIDGFVADEQNNALGGICVVFYLNGSWNGYQITNGDGSWSFTPGTQEAMQLAIFRPSIPGDCTSTPQSSGPVPEWFQDIKLGFSDPTKATPEPNAVFVNDGTSTLMICLGENELYTGGCSPKGGDQQPTGPGKLSGRVLQPGALPVEKACVFLLPKGGEGGWPAITDSEGRWSIANLPTDLSFVVGVVPPFDTGQGPCQFEEGPPPVPPEGGLQPEWYANAWINLASPDLDHDVYSYAVASGAETVVANQAELDVCLTTDPGGTTSRAACEVAAAQAVAGTLPLTGGRDTTLPALAGTTVLLVGLGLVALARRGRSNPRHAA